MNYWRFFGAIAVAIGTICTTSNLVAQQGTLWTNVFDGGTSREDRPAVVARDNAGNFFVGGYAVTETNNLDILVMKYGPDGTLSSTWPDVGYGVGVRRYNGTGNDRDTVAAMTTDVAGNLYVAGTLGKSGIATTAPDDDACVLKYDPNGNLAMVIRLTPGSFDSSVAMHVGGTGRIYLLVRQGTSLGTMYLYEANGTLSSAWPNIGNGTGIRRLPFEGQSFVVAPDQSVYVLGRQNHYMNYVDQELTITKLAPNGVGVWTNYYAGPIAGNDTAVKIALAPDGEIVALGNAPGNGVGTDYLLWRLQPDGSPSAAWPDVGQGAGVRRYDANARVDTARSLKIDAQGNTYVSGSASRFPSNYDFVTWKLDPQGNPSAEWPDIGFGQGIRIYQGAGTSADEVWDMALDAQGNVFVTGRGNSGPNTTYPYDALTISYARTGEVLWKATYSGGSNIVDTGMCILTDDSRGVFVVGYTGPSPQTDVFVAKYYHNTAPVPTPTSAVLPEDGLALVSLSGYDREGDAFSATVSTLPANGSLSLSGADIVYSPALNFNGSDSFSFVLTDSFATSAPAAVQLNVTPVNDAPVVPPGTIYGQPLEDNPYTLTFDMLVAGLQATDVDGDALTILVQRVDGGTLTKAGLPVVPGVTLVLPGESLTWRPATNVYGGFLPGYAISAYDGNLVSATSTEVRMSVIAVNDAPSFGLSSSSYTLPKNANATTLTGLATSISAGPANESSQAVTFHITNNNAALFTAQPAMTSSGTLTFTPKKGAKGQAVLTIVAKDTGGTANGGVDTSTAKTFTIIAK
ncbi:MAG TPA: Ig-like domain-containing protein [Verrucomicrobiae bacterium]